MTKRNWKPTEWQTSPNNLTLPGGIVSGQKGTMNGKVTYNFSYEVQYGNSSNSSHYNPDTSQPFTTATEAQHYGLQEALRLASYDGTIVKSLTIEAFCPECNGRGVIYTKTGKRIQKTVEKKCSVCKGNDSTVIIV